MSFPRFRPYILFLLLGGGAVRAGGVADEKEQLAGQVREIFEAKCVDCHGPELPRPKGKFGYILDLHRVAANREYIVPKNPEKSELYKMVEDDEMPGEDANVPPLTPEEKAVVRRWILEGAVVPAPPSKILAEGEAAAKPREKFWRHLFRWGGQFHPVTTHFPIALLFVAVFAETIGAVTRRPTWSETVRFLVILAAIGATVSAISGWVNASFSSYNKAAFALLWWHRWLGTATAVWAIVCAGASLATHEDGSGVNRWHFRVALFLGAALVGICGFLGSALIYGLDHYIWR